MTLIDDAVRWVRYRFDSPERDDLDAMVQECIERDPSFAVLLKRAIEDRVEAERRSPPSAPGSYKRARGALRGVDER